MNNHRVERPFTCGQCGAAFKQKKHVVRHTKTVHGDDRVVCADCGSLFTRESDLRRHMMSMHRPAPVFNPAYRPATPQPGPSSAPDPVPDQPQAADAAAAGGFQCDGCERTFTRADNIRRHVRYHCRGGGRRNPQPAELQPPASPAPSSSASSTSSASPRREDDLDVLPDDLAPEGFEEFQTAFRGRLKTFRLSEPAEETVTLQEFLNTTRGQVITLMRRILECTNAIKANIWVECEFTNVHGETCRRAFKTKNEALFQSSDIDNICLDLFNNILLEKEACEIKGSGWTFVRVLDMQIRINVYSPLRGSSYIPLPQEISRKKAIVNVLNDADERCFEYAILSKFVENSDRLRTNMFTAEVRTRANLNFNDLTFPVKLDKIRTFERNNPGVSVNVYGLDKKQKKQNNQLKDNELFVYPLRVVDRELDNHFDLLLLTDEETTHYAYISDFERLVTSQLTRREHRIHICKRCFAYFDERPTKLGIAGAERLAEHRRYCSKNAPLRTELSEEKEIKFKHFERTQRARFTIYADFECALVPLINQPIQPTPVVQPPAWDPAIARGARQHNAEMPANVRNVHVPYAYAYYIRDDLRNVEDGDCDDPASDTFSQLRLYRGEDAAQHFINSVRDDVQKIGDIVYGRRMPNDLPQLTPLEEFCFRRATVCHICKREFRQDDDIKVRDHQHSPPYKYRGAAHQSCNLRYKEQETVNIYLHNLSNYDAHFIVRELAVDKGDIDVLANTEEKYITFSKRFKYPGAGRRNSIKLQFVDSYRLMSKSLAALAAILPADKMHITRVRVDNDQEKIDLLRRKGIFPYEYITSMEVLEEDSLPAKEVFGDNVTDEDYAHAQSVWTKFNCTTLGQYADIYLQTDVLLLADVFEGFREMCLTHYNLDPAHYLTLPSYAWDVMLFKTGVVLDTLQDVDQYLFFEKGIRGGLTQCVTRHVTANNKFTRAGGGGDNPSTSSVEHDDDTFLMYYDANNLYGWAMSEPLPYADFEWLSPLECNNFNIMDIPADGEYGYVLEVDLEYPRDQQALHDRHRDLPFCPEVRKSPPYQLPYSSDDVINSGAGHSKKLMATLLDKEEYVIHYRYLQQALENGLRLRHIHRVLRFKQSAWLKPYVTLNTQLRQQAANKFEVEMFKLMVNAVYGMSLQNVRKHLNLKIAASRKIYTKYVAKANFNDRVWYNESLALLHMDKVRVVLSKPVYAGMCILDHSKRWMYGFHYDMIDRYGIQKIRMAYMDTDGIIYAIRTKDVYRDMLEHLDDFDTSNYPRNHICYDGRNAKVLGKFKDEAGGVAIKMFVGLMAKLYSIVFGMRTCGAIEGNGDVTDDNFDAPPPIKKAKGVNRAVVQNQLTVDDYLDCLHNKVCKSTDNQRFQSKYHIIYTAVVRKRSLAPFDDKRYVMPEDGINTLPWGHYAVPPRAPPLPAAPFLPPPLMEIDD